MPYNIAETNPPMSVEPNTPEMFILFGYFAQGEFVDELAVR